MLPASFPQMCCTPRIIVACNVSFSRSGSIRPWLRAQLAASVCRQLKMDPTEVLAMLPLVAWYRAQTGQDYVYGNNDLPHFVLQLFLASDWAGRSDWSFNGPIWSISVEILVYALFYGLCRLGVCRWIANHG